ncbi:hypothetical protein Pmani_016276 [Petrolisthes manimaculis]|uniref:Uncharacterized protein n=1 Tax=Petrolisthes manimaculis TaxID=1843537 RepID=A0AAE1PQD8_9EUCA|nr:hypothetical protein Pmani_016276 [Petrolisthes manimaculis]
MNVQVSDDKGDVTDIKVSTTIEHRYAITHVSTTILNPRLQDARIALQLSIPRTALISGLIIEAGGRNYSGRVYDRASANSVSEATKQGGKTTALLQFGEEDVEHVTVRAKVPALHSYIFHVTYEELVQRRSGSYIYTLHISPGQRVPCVSINLRVLEQEEITDYRVLELPGQELQSPLPGSSVTADPVSPRELHIQYQHEDHPQGPLKGVDGTFTFSYSTRIYMDGGELQHVGNYFAHFFSPEPLPELRVHTVYLVDVSHSMQDDRLLHIKTLLSATLPNIHKDESFEVLVFSSDVVSLGTFNGRKKSVKRALRRVKKLEALGDSDLNAGLTQALKNAASHDGTQAIKQIVVFSDGQPTSGMQNPTYIRSSVQKANIEHIPIYSFVFGDGSNKLLEHICLSSHGFAQAANPFSLIHSQLKAFMERIATPLVSQVNISYPGADPNSVARHGTQNYYSGSELVFVGRLASGSQHIHPRVTGHVAEGLTEFPLSRINYENFRPTEKSSVARLWAYLKVQDLLTKAECAQSHNLTRHYHAHALLLAQELNFVTRVTSMVAVYPDASLLLARPGSVRPHNNLHLPQHDQPGPQQIAAAFSGPNRPGRSYIGGTIPHSYVDLDPHFVVRSPNLNLPICFNFNSPRESFVSLIRDPQSGIILNGQLSSAASQPFKTFFSRLFLSLGSVNITISPQEIQVDCLQDDGTPKIRHVTRSLWPYYRKNGRRYKYREDRQIKRRKARRTKTTMSNSISGSPISDTASYYHYNSNRRQASSKRDTGIENTMESCQMNTTWEAGIGSNYEDVMMVMSKKKHLQISLGDGLAHLTVIRSRSKEYLGLYIKQQRVLSTHTQGIIGHLTFTRLEPLTHLGSNGSSSNRVQLEAHSSSSTGASQVSGTVVRRRSLLARTHTHCININQPQTLLDRPPGKYLIECLTC